MTTVRPFRCADLLKFSNVNLDQWTETYNLPYYQHYMAMWPRLTVVAETADGRVAGYLLGKVEGRGLDWHGHVTAVTVAPEYRRLGLASWFMKHLEAVSEAARCRYVDLYVRQSNSLAIGLYKRLGYTAYRRVLGYYSGEEDAFDMRKALSADPTGQSVRPHVPFDVRPPD